MSFDLQLLCSAAAAFVAIPAIAAIADWLRPVAPSAVPDPVPTGAEAGEYRWCPEESRTTYHAMHADGGRTCWACGTPSPQED